MKIFEGTQTGSNRLKLVEKSIKIHAKNHKIIFLGNRWVADVHFWELSTFTSRWFAHWKQHRALQQNFACYFDHNRQSSHIGSFHTLMDRLDYEIDEEDVADREYQHGISSFHILLLLLMELIYVLIHVTASFWLTDFYLLNPFFLLLSMDGALVIVKRCFSGHLRQQAVNFQFTSMSIALMSLILQITIIPEDTLGFAIRTQHMVLGFFVITFILCSLLITIFA